MAFVRALFGRDLVREAVVIFREHDLRVGVLRLTARDAVGPGVVRRDVLRARVREDLVAPLHLVDRPLERRRRLFHVGDDQAGWHVRDAIDRCALHHLRVAHQEAELVGRATVEQREEHHVQADALSRAGRAGHDDVRHAREVGVDGVPQDVSTEDDRERHVERLEAPILHEIAQDDLHAAVVRQLEADPVLARDRGHDADLARERQREIIGEARDLGHLRPGRGRHLVRRHGRPGEDVLDLALHSVVRQRLDERLRVGEELVPVHRGASAPPSRQRAGSTLGSWNDAVRRGATSTSSFSFSSAADVSTIVGALRVRFARPGEASSAAAGVGLSETLSLATISEGTGGAGDPSSRSSSSAFASSLASAGGVRRSRSAPVPGVASLPSRRASRRPSPSRRPWRASAASRAAGDRPGRRPWTSPRRWPWLRPRRRRRARGAAMRRSPCRAPTCRCGAR